MNPRNSFHDGVIVAVQKGYLDPKKDTGATVISYMYDGKSDLPQEFRRDFINRQWKNFCFHAHLAVKEFEVAKNGDDMLKKALNKRLNCHWEADDLAFPSPPFKSLDGMAKWFDENIAACFYEYEPAVKEEVTDKEKEGGNAGD